jgi:hypothetical protein
LFFIKKYVIIYIEKLKNIKKGSVIMDWNKYEQIPEEFATAREIGLAPQTLAAMARRGLVEILDTVPKQYKRINSSSVRIYQLCEENSKNLFGSTYFILYKSNQKIGMLCSIVNNTIVDCNGVPYNLENVNKIKFKNKEVVL